ncbi:type II toxin-antitoxin system RelB/DinJ family antitoxin [Bifidobacterium sp. 64T4]|uniref:type II toxin-antitoxin system RelB/DinJ family antitoxin n=1 Tax=Bifidobacterium pongonis TaxID=2834432 RepID=UPI001C572DDC|nr:type II toxin-antitoxin system RelB/DinJ family antitoxin [Bifidobacterium pongonis]MBW3095499.1 type II toxin-antitoxin system RelB/DinJ family antitoxin [Bifidobacterium pongonis]
MTMSSVTVRVDSDTKRQASHIAEDFGLDLSSVTRAFYRQIVREHRIPLNLSYPTMPTETAEALAEAREKAGTAEPRFNTADEMFEALEI